MLKILLNITWISWITLFTMQAHATDIRLEQEKLMMLDLADLMNVKVDSAAKKSQTLSQSTAAIFVITEEDIRRSGATQIAEVLRMVPGLQVAGFNSYTWAVSARGFNGIYANKLLVLVDGRSVYNPELSGVYWDVLNTTVSDIARIEVIRGPGGTLWGANAVNGVINITTKNISDIKSSDLVEIGGGTQLEHLVGIRHSGTLDLATNTHYRVYAKNLQYAGSPNNIASDRWRIKQTGFRLDSDLFSDDSLTFQGEVTQANEQDIHWLYREPGTTRVSNQHLLSHWKHRFSEHSDLALNLYYDRSDREFVTFQILSRTLDLDINHHWRVNDHHDVVWGLGYRYINSNIPKELLRFTPPKRNDSLFNIFVQDDISLVPEKFVLTVGAKLEHNDYTGIEFQPNLRLLWTPTETQSFWAAISRATHTPARYDSDSDAKIIFPSSEINTLGNKNLVSETVLAYELGWRNQLRENLSLDTTVFYNRYKNLITTNQWNDVTPDVTVLNNQQVNGAQGNTFGAELALDWSKAEWLRLQLAYSYLKMQLHATDPLSKSYESINDENPRHQLSLRNYLRFSDKLNLNTWLRYVDDLPATYFENVNAYLSLDLRLAWQISKQLEFSIVGKNLFDNHHDEIGTVSLNPLNSQLERTIYGQLRWEF